MPKSSTPPVMYIDPVCWTVVSPEGNTLRTHYRMRGYYFCSEACRKAFEADPKRYLEFGSSGKKGWLRRCLERVRKGSGGEVERRF